MGKKQSDTTSQESTTTSNPWDPAIPYLENILSQADKLFNDQGGINKEWLDKEIADLTPEMQGVINNMVNQPQFQQLAGNISNMATQGAQGLGQAQGILGGLAGQGITSDKLNEMAADLYDSDLVASQKANLATSVQDTLEKNNQAINQRAVSSGGMGSSRAGIAEGVAAGEAADAMAQGSASIENAARQQAYGQALGTLQGNQQTALGAAGQLGQLGLGSLGQMGNLGNLYLSSNQQGLIGAGIGQQHNQNVLNNKWFNQQGQQNAGWDALSKYMGMVGSIGGMGGTSHTQGTSTNTTSGGGFNQLLGLGATAGGIMSGLGAMGFSDASLKTKVKRKGKTKDGIGKYDWQWNKSAKKRVGKEGKESGALAQDVAKKRPDAVSRDKESGALMVDYDKISVKNKKKK